MKYLKKVNIQKLKLRRDQNHQEYVDIFILKIVNIIDKIYLYIVIIYICVHIIYHKNRSVPNGEKPTKKLRSSTSSVDQEKSSNTSSINSEGNSTSEIQSSINNSSSSVSKPQNYPHSKLHHEINSSISTPQNMSDSSSGMLNILF